MQIHEVAQNVWTPFQEDCFSFNLLPQVTLLLPTPFLTWPSNPLNIYLGMPWVSTSAEYSAGSFQFMNLLPPGAPPPAIAGPYAALW